MKNKFISKRYLFFCVFAFLDLPSVLGFVPNPSVIRCLHALTWCGKKWPEMFCKMAKPHSPMLNVSCWVLRYKRTSLCELCFDFPVKGEHRRASMLRSALTLPGALVPSLLLFHLLRSCLRRNSSQDLEAWPLGTCHLALTVHSLCTARNWVTYAVTFLLWPPAGTGKKGGKAGTGFTFSG